MLQPLLRRYLVLLLILGGSPVCAWSMIVESGQTVVIDSATSEDIYLVAGTVIINAPVHGDLVVAGGKIYINDSVNNILLIGGTVEINGYVAGKIRCLGGTLHIARLVQGDLVAAGGDITLQKNAVIAGDVLAAGGNLYIYGNIEGNVRAAAGKFQLYGDIGRDLTVRSGDLELYGRVLGKAALAASDKLSIGQGASFQGTVRYWSPNTVSFGHASVPGTPLYDESLAFGQTHWYFLGAAGWLAILWYLASALLVIALLQYFFPSLFHRAGQRAYDKMLSSLGVGALYVVSTPLAIALLFLTLVAIPVAVALLMGYVLSLVICGSVASLVASHWFVHVLGIEGNNRKHILGALGLFILFRLIASVPFFGWILAIVMVCIAFGALLSVIRWKGVKAPSSSQRHAIIESQSASVQKA